MHRILLLLPLLILLASESLAQPTGTTTKGADQPPPERTRVVDWKFITLTALSIGAAVLDVEGSQRAMQRCPTCTEASSWLMGSRPSRGRMYATILPLKIAETYAAYRIKKEGARGWFVVPSLGGAVNTFGGLHSLSVTAPTPKTCPAGGAGCATQTTSPGN